MTYGNYPPPPPPIPPSGPPKRGMSTGSKFGLGCGIAAILGFVLLVGGCMAAIVASPGGDSVEPADPPAADAGGSDSGGGDSGGEGSGGEKAAKIGDTVETGAFAFTVTDVETGVQSVGDNPYLTETPDGEYVIVHVTVENIGDQAGTFDSMSQKLLDADGKEYSTDSAAQMSVDTDTWINEINPGNSVDGQLIFDVPAEVEPKSVKLYDFLSFDQAAEIDLK